MTKVGESKSGDLVVAGSTVPKGGAKGSAAQRKRKEAPLDVEGGSEAHHQLMQTYRSNVADHMKRLRKRDGLRQKDLAILMNTGQGHIAFLETARRNFGLETLARIAEVFKVEPTSLLVPLKYADEVETAAMPELQPSPATSESISIGPTEALQAPLLPQDQPLAAPDLIHSSIGVGISLTAVKRIAGATYKRIEALERRHGGIPMTREMLTSVLLTVLSASQNLDDESNELG